MTEGRRVFSNVIFSQIDIHRKWGGVYPSLAKREHEEKIEPVIKRALEIARVKLEKIGAVAVTFGPGLVIALEVGIRKARELAERSRRPLIPVDHLEGHIYSCFAQNQKGKPERDFQFPFLALIVSGGHTSLVMVKDHLDYEVIGQTLDDALGEALDKAAKVLGLGYPGGPIIEKLAEKGDPDYLKLPLPLTRDSRLAFSYSGLKTAFKNQLTKMSPPEVVRNLPHLAASFQEKAFNHLLNKLSRAIDERKPVLVTGGGGVIANKKLRRSIRSLVKEKGIKVYFPRADKLIGDNAAMIGVVADYKYRKKIYLEDDFDRLDRVARPNFRIWTKGK